MDPFHPILELLSLDSNKFGIGGNRFSGVLPCTISNLSKLSDLDVVDNQFTGPVPKLGTLHGLITTNFERNYFGGDLSFFNSLSNCSHLEVFSVTLNNLTGQLPASIANLSTKLTQLYMGGNNIFGEIPPAIENLVSLNGLGIEDNQLTGSIPVSIGKLPKLISLTIWGNQFSGKIPSNICNSSQLEQIVLSGNRLQGGIPSNFGNCLKLQHLDLSENQLTGTIPKQLIGLSSLSNLLNLSWNHLTGDLPSEIGNLVKIVNLDLSNNKISGNIPSSIKNCLGLQIL